MVDDPSKLSSFAWFAAFVFHVSVEQDANPYRDSFNLANRLEKQS
jgi:hypothetical protein